MNKIYLPSRQLAPICRACAQASTFREGVGHIMQFCNIYQSRYNNEEQHKILQVINDSSAEELSRFDISKNRINNLQQFRRKRGPFYTLGEVLEVDGLGVKVLEKLCDSILKNSTASSQNNLSDSEIADHIKSLNKRSKFQVVTPALHSNQINVMETAVGIHIGVSAVTWAHMDRNGNVLAWDIYNLEFSTKRPHLISLYEVAKDICDNVAKGDIYVLEDKGISTVPTKQQQPSSISVHLQNYQLTAMFLALLNSSVQSFESELQKYEHIVFFLRSRLPARLFRTLVGSERVSAQSVVIEILSQQTEHYEYSPVLVSDELKQIYLNRTAMEKEGLCSALLLIMTFMDLVVHKNPLSLQSIKNGNSRNKQTW